MFLALSKVSRADFHEKAHAEEEIFIQHIALLRFP